jgi:hypothetical protein
MFSPPASNCSHFLHHETKISQKLFFIVIFIVIAHLLYVRMNSHSSTNEVKLRYKGVEVSHDSSGRNARF